jgi:serine/threonine protein kinase
MKKKEEKMKGPKKADLSCYEVLQTIGTGSFGRVRLAKNTYKRTMYAIKILKKSEIIRVKQVDHIYSECSILSNTQHPFIVSFTLYRYR